MNKLHLKMWRSVTALVLAVCMLFGSTGTAFATGADGEGSEATKSYVSLGDSMTNGYGLNGYEYTYTDGAGESFNVNVNGYLQVAPEAYPAQVAGTMGWDLTQLAISAMRAEDLHYILDYGTEGAYTGDEYTEKEFINKRFKDFEDVPEEADKAGVEAVARQFQTSVADADVVSVCIGNANFGVFLLGRITNALGVLGGNTNGDEWISFEKALTLCDEETKVAALTIYEQVKASVMGYVPAEQTELVDALTNAIGYTVVSYVLNYNGVLDRIIELNPDAEIIIVGIMNTMSGLDVAFEVEGETYTIDMGTILAPVIESVNLYLAALPAAKQALDVYTEATFYYAEASNVDMLVSEYAVAADDWEKYPTVRERFITEVLDTVFPMIGISSKKEDGKDIIARADVEAYEAAVASGDAALACHAKTNSEQALACAIYLAFEKAVVSASQVDTLNAEAFVKLATGLDGIFDTVLGKYEENTQVAIKDNYYVRVVENVILPQLKEQNPEANLPTALSYLDTADGATYKAQVIDICTLLATPDALSDALLADETVTGLLNLFARMIIGDGIGCHPSATGHDTITNAIISSYEAGYTAADSVTDKVTAALENLYDLLVEYGPDAVEAAYAYADEMGYIDDLKNAAEELLAKAEAELNNFAEDVKPEIEAAIAELEKQLAALENELAEKKAELTGKLEELKTLLEEKKAELENASAELKAEIEAAIEEIEAAIEALENAIAEIEAKIAEVKNAIAELEQELAEINEKLQALTEAAAELKEAIEELIQIAAGEVEGNIEEAIAKIQAAIDKVGEAVDAAEALADAVNEAIDSAVSMAKDIIDAVAKLDEAIEKAIEDAKESVEQAIEDLKAELEKAAEDLKAEIEAKVKEAISELEAAAEELVAELEAAAKELATELITEAAQAIEEAASKLYAEATEKLDEVVEEVVAKFEAAYADATTGEYTVSDDSHYVALGDSSVYGFGLENEKEGYAYKLAEELGLDVDTQFTNLSDYGVSAEECRTVVAENADVIAKSDLITIGFSNNTFVTFVAEQMMAATTGRPPVEMDWSLYVGAEGVPYIEDALEEVKAYFLESGMDTTYADLMTLAVESYAYSYVGYVCNYPEVVNAIRAINPDALVIIVGMYNPLEDVVIKVGETEVAIGEYVGYLVDLTKLHTTVFAMLTSDAIYVDAPEVETIQSASQMDVMGFVAEYVYYKGTNMHAGLNGHEYIKEQILNALTITVEEDDVLLGDVNLDGKVNSTDLNLLYRYVMKRVTLSELQLKNGDVNQDGTVNSTDVNRLFRYVMKKVDTL